MAVQPSSSLSPLGAVLFTARNFFLTRESQLADRYTKAVEQIGSQNIDARLGGLFALEQIMRQSSDYHDVVLRLTTTFVYEHSPVSAPNSARYVPRFGSNPTPRGWISRIAYNRPAADIRAALLVIARRPEASYSATLDLSSVDICGAYGFDGADLRSIDFTGSDLREADFRGVDLQEATFHDADLRGTVFVECDLRRANFRGAKLDGAVLLAAHLRYAEISETRVAGALTEQTIKGVGLIDG